MSIIYLQPADWIEHDVSFRYAVDVFGRTHNGDVARCRLTGFHPYLYVRAYPNETPNSIETALRSQSDKPIRDISVTLEKKLDAMRGFSGLTPTSVWKIKCKSLWMFKHLSRLLKSHIKIGNRILLTEDIYEEDLPPLLRLFHERELSPASPIMFTENVSTQDDECNVDVCYEVQYTSVTPFEKISIPLYVASYDLEVYSDSGQFPVATNPKDEITQIGVSFRWSDSMLDTVARYVFVSGTVDPSKDQDVQFIACRNEKDLLQKFAHYINTENPDIVCGYNTFGFDDAYVADRAEKNNISLSFGRVEVKQWGKQECVKTEKKTFELASGKFAVRYINMPGRLSIDLYLSMRREQNLDSYKLDNIANVFLRDKVTNIIVITGENTQLYEVHTKNTRGLFAGNLVRFDIVTNTSNPYREGAKFLVKEVHAKKFIIELPRANHIFDDLDKNEMKKLEWSFAKDDVDHHAIFAAHKGTTADRANIAKYCIQDCDLVLTLMAKLDTLVNARGMADVCRVPIQYIFLRGQGIKIYSAVIYTASKRNQIIMTQDSVDGDSSYEGAIVLPPKIGMYMDQPIPVLDFNSLYPSNMIAYNLSPDTLVYVKEYDMNGRLKSHNGPTSVDGYKIDEVGYDVKNEEGEAIGQIKCGFAQPSEDPMTVGLLPITLDILLKKRKETRKMIELTDDDAQKSVLNGLQLAYKVVANSIYGQCGSKTSAIRNINVAACTTAVGRQKIYDAKKIIEEQFGATVIAGDTDSVFIKFQTKSLSESIKLAKQAAEIITASGRKAHKIEYEKTFYPFILFCRKRYVGMMYEDDPTAKPKRKVMGVALKRRDNAPIVKDIFGGALDILMEERDIRKAQRFVQNMLVDVIQNKMPLEKFILSKQLRDDYVTEVPADVRSHTSTSKPYQLNSNKASFNMIRDYSKKYDLTMPKSSIAHRSLADRMEERDAGNKPQVGDRLAYIFVDERKGNKKQGDKIEHIDYVRQKGLKPDTEFYVTNQIQNPVAQLFALAIDQLEGYKPRIDYKAMLNSFIEDGMDEEEATLAVLKKKEKELDSLMFMGAQYLKKHKRGPMDMFVKR